MHDLTSTELTCAVPFANLPTRRMCAIIRTRSSQSIRLTLAVDAMGHLLGSATLSDELVRTRASYCEDIEASSVVEQ